MIRHCPECRGPLEARNGMARCTVHGGEYKILFWREVEAQPSLSELLGCPARTTFAEVAETPEPPAAAAEEVSSPPGVPSPLPVLPSLPPLPPHLPLPGERTQAWCVTHPDFPALFVCHRCQAPICEVCGFPNQMVAGCVRSAPRFKRGGGVSRWGHRRRLGGAKPAMRPASPRPGLANLPLCGAPVCATCDSLLPGDFHVCPTCAVTPHTRLSPARKVALLASLALAVWSTLEMAGLFTGFLHGWGHETEVVLGAWPMLLMVTPSTAGLALGSGLLAHHIHGRATKLAIFLAAIWNGLAIVFYLGLVLMKMAKP